jgi:hypothetical protein
VYLDHSISCKMAALVDISLFSQLPVSKMIKPTQLFVVSNGAFLSNDFIKRVFACFSRSHDTGNLKI